jgi:hypothetical protein
VIFHGHIVMTKSPDFTCIEVPITILRLDFENDLAVSQLSASVMWLEAF